MASRFVRTFIANIAETIGHIKLLSQAHMQFYHMYVFIIRASQQHIV